MSLSFKILVSFILGSTSVFSAPETISPKSSLEISAKEMIADHNQPIPFACPDLDPKTHITYKKVLFHQMDLTLYCVDDYLGGVYAINTSGNKKLVLGQQDGDAGDSWDYQTLIFQDQNKDIIFWVKSHFIHDPSIDCDTMTNEEKKKSKINCKGLKLECKKADVFYKWDQSSRLIIPTTFKGKLPRRQLKPKENFQKVCL